MRTFNCELCGCEGKTENPKDVRFITNIKEEVERPTDLIFLSPDDKWICNMCFRKLSKRVPVAKK